MAECRVNAWWMPLVGDAVIGVAALGVTALVWRGKGLMAWSTIMLFHALGAWDAVSAWMVSLSNPWPEFFMLQMMGPAMFVGAVAMHVVAVGLLWRPAVRDTFSLSS